MGTNNYDSILVAAKNGHLDIVKWLWEKGHKNCDELMLRSAEFGHLNIVKWLWEKNVDIRANNDAALRIASRNKTHIIYNCDYKTKFMRLITKDCSETIKWLLEKGADVTANNNEPVRVASEYGQYTILPLLLEYGADI